MNITSKHIYKLAIPAIISGISEPILSLTDLAIIGNVKHHSVEALAAVGIVTTFISMLIWVFGQSRSAISSLVSQHLGAHKLDDIKTLPAQVIVLLMVLSFLVIGFTFFLASSIFRLYNASALILDYSVSYYQIRVFGFPFTLFTIAVFGVFRGLQNTKTPMVIAIVGTIVNIVLDYLLVYGVSGYFEGLHLEGAAYASVIAQLTMAVLSGYYMLKKTDIPLRIIRPIHPKIRTFLAMILNLFVRTLALNIALYLATSFATAYGKNYVSAYTIAINLWFFGAFFIDGFASAGNILSGKLYGAKEYELLLKLSTQLMKYGLVVGLGIGTLGGVFYPYIGHLFTNDAGVYKEFYHIFWMVLAMQPLCALAFIFDGIFKGLGKMKTLRNVLLWSTFLVFLPAILLTDIFDLKLHGILIAFTLWIVARGVPLIYIFKKEFRALAGNV